MADELLKHIVTGIIITSFITVFLLIFPKTFIGYVQVYNILTEFKLGIVAFSAFLFFIWLVLRKVNYLHSSIFALVFFLMALFI
jgi:hypothetical protein